MDKKEWCSSAVLSINENVIWGKFIAFAPRILSYGRMPEWIINYILDYERNDKDVAKCWVFELFWTLKDFMTSFKWHYCIFFTWHEELVNTLCGDCVCLSTYKPFEKYLELSLTQKLKIICLNYISHSVTAHKTTVLTMSVLLVRQYFLVYTFVNTLRTKDMLLHTYCCFLWDHHYKNTFLLAWVSAIF
jgi:hypothetical protein